VTTFHKQSPADPDALLFEAAGLRWLAAAAPQGGVRVVRITHEGRGRLDLERITGAAPTAAAARAFGAALARTHAAVAPAFGAGPPGWVGPGRIGLAELPLLTSATGSAGGAGTVRRSWGEFYATDRLLPYVRSAVDRRALDVADAAVVERLADRVAGGHLDAAQPALVPGPVARIHGDLWSGNVLWDARAGAEAVLIDPAAHGGHAETDLAMLALFGQPRFAEIVAGYEEASPLASGWRERVGLHQLHPLLVHATAFGAGYGRRAAMAAARL
jgi:fructosamine-3-kinase